MTEKVNLREEIRKARTAQRDELKHLLDRNPAEVAKMLTTEPASLAQLLALAAQDLAGKGMTARETEEFATAFSNNPSLLARLLSGMVA